MRKERVADSEGIGRLANEVLNRSASESWGPDDEATFRCECGDDVCSEPLTIPRDLYERVRGDSMLFLIRPSHEVPEAEDVIEQGDGYWIVRKHEDIRPIVESSDPRA